MAYGAGKEKLEVWMVKGTKKKLKALARKQKTTMTALAGSTLEKLAAEK